MPWCSRLAGQVVGAGVGAVLRGGTCGSPSLRAALNCLFERALRCLARAGQRRLTGPTLRKGPGAQERARVGKQQQQRVGRAMVTWPWRGARSRAARSRAARHRGRCGRRRGGARRAGGPWRGWCRGAALVRGTTGGAARPAAAWNQWWMLRSAAVGVARAWVRGGRWQHALAGRRLYRMLVRDNSNLLQRQCSSSRVSPTHCARASAPITTRSARPAA